MEGPQFSTRAESDALPLLGRRRHRHDEPDRGEALPARPRSVTRPRARHRLRLLARRTPRTCRSRRSWRSSSENAAAARRTPSRRRCAAWTRRAAAPAGRDAVRHPHGPRGDPGGGERRGCGRSRGGTLTRADSLRTAGIVVTGSVAFDYLMTFPGKFIEHLIPDRMSRLSVSFLVDEMRRVPGGCGPNIA